MSTVAFIAFVILAVPTMTITLYLGALALASWAYRPPRTELSDDPPHFALIIPAHNEGAGIQAILEDVRQVNYPADSVTVFVVADNCDDDTADKARAAGATVLERHDRDHPGKGQALDWCLKTHEESLRAHDAIALVDADMEIDPGFFRALAEALATPGVEVVQALNTVARPERTWRTALGYLGFTAINHVRPAGRCFFGGTGELKGSGMAFRSELLLAYGWPAHSIAEDVEFSKRLLLDGHRVHYVPTALVTSEIPTHQKQAGVQQARWEGGRFYLVRHYLPRFFVEVLKRPTPARLDALLDLIVPPQSLLALLLVAFFVVAALVGVKLMVWPLVAAGCVALYVLSGPAQRRAPLRVWLYLGAAPALVAWKLALYGKMLLGGGPKGWVRTPRDNEIE
jgi:cellulose synthase/poly-beta-1,6-N-acetylglucosamine synthase-like glycosyltransferase